MKVIEKIFPKGGYYITSGWGNRTYWLNGKQVNDFHNGIDYGTNGEKWTQYAIEDGYIVSCGIDKAGGDAKFVWVAYPRIGKKFLHYHLDSIAVEKGQKVKEGTKLGKTGTTGWSTGIHLHLGMKDINGSDYQNVEEYDYQPPAEAVDPFPGVSDEELAKRVWAGEFGNGDARKEALGDRYDSVQALVDKGVGKPEETKKEEPKPASTDKYLNLSHKVTSWTVYKTNDHYVKKNTSDVLMILNPNKYGGLSYRILEDMGNYHYKIETDMKGIGYISGNPKYPCTVTEKPTYSRGKY